MLHIVHLIQRHRGGRPPAVAPALAVISALALAAGLILLAGR